MADATLSELAEGLYVSEGDVRAVLAALLDDPQELPDPIPQELCGEVSEVLDPWPLVRRVPDEYGPQPQSSLA